MSGATPPEVWASGGFLPEGHTVSMSDMYFVAHFLHVVSSMVGSAASLAATSLQTSSGARIATDIVVKCVGFELNEANEVLLGRSHLRGGLLVSDGLWTVFEAHPDGNFSGGAFGSYLDNMVFKCRVLDIT